MNRPCVLQKLGLLAAFHFSVFSNLQAMGIFIHSSAAFGSCMTKVRGLSSRNGESIHRRKEILEALIPTLAMSNFSTSSSPFNLDYFRKFLTVLHPTLDQWQGNYRPPNKVRFDPS
ncbi:hypothetical protein OIU85_017058 [Salix viminalis]|uniref:Uncharacterized protein n=1 Tax=Salix viminalis TaxID=40686 RepID=A0A9Q0ZQH1_SALVM|nr:hypothetical protein OIU85_017058 [Salix viminalis]